MLVIHNDKTSVDNLVNISNLSTYKTDIIYTV